MHTNAIIIVCFIVIVLIIIAIIFAWVNEKAVSLLYRPIEPEIEKDGLNIIISIVCLLLATLLIVIVILYQVDKNNFTAVLESI